jgi:hypothetical protein
VKEMQEVTEQIKNMDILSEDQSARDNFQSTAKKPPLMPASTPLLTTMVDLHSDIKKPPPEPPKQRASVTL